MLHVPNSLADVKSMHAVHFLWRAGDAGAGCIMDVARQVAVCEFAQSQLDLNFMQINTMRQIMKLGSNRQTRQCCTNTTNKILLLFRGVFVYCSINESYKLL